MVAWSTGVCRSMGMLIGGEVSQQVHHATGYVLGVTVHMLGRQTPHVTSQEAGHQGCWKVAGTTVLEGVHQQDNQGQ